MKIYGIGFFRRFKKKFLSSKNLFLKNYSTGFRWFQFLQESYAEFFSGYAQKKLWRLRIREGIFEMVFFSGYGLRGYFFRGYASAATTRKSYGPQKSQVSDFLTFFKTFLKNYSLNPEISVSMGRTGCEKLPMHERLRPIFSKTKSYDLPKSQIFDF